MFNLLLSHYEVSGINCELHNQAKFKIHGYLVEPALNRLVRENDTITLETKVMAALLLLVEHRQQLVSRQNLREKLWGNTVVSDNAINRVISQLRKAFRDDQSPYSVITTIPKKGYQLVAEVVAVTKNVSSPSLSNTEIKQQQFSSLFPVISMCLIVLFIGLWEFNQQPAFKSFTSKGAVKIFTTLPGLEHSPSYNFNNRWLAFIHYDVSKKISRLMLQANHSAQPLELFSTNDSIDSFVWSPTENVLILALKGDDGCRLEWMQVHKDLAEVIQRRTVINCYNKMVNNMAWSSFDNNLYLTSVNGVDSDLYKISMSDHSPLLQKVTQGAGAYFVAVASDGKQLALLRHQQFERSQIYLFDVTKNSDRLFYQSPYFLQGISWAREGRALFYNELTQFKLHGLEGEVQTLSFSSEQPVLDSYFVADLEKFFYVGSRSEVRLQQISKQNDQWSEAIMQPWGADANEVHPVYSHDGKRLAFISNRSGDNRIWIKDNKDKLRVLDTEDFDLSQTLLRWSPDDRYLMYHAGRSLYRYDLTNNYNQRISPEQVYADVVSWSYQDQDKIYFRNNDDGEMNIWQLGIAEKKLTRITHNGGFSANVSVDGHYLYHTKHQQVGLWRLTLDTGESKLILDDFHWGNWGSWQLIKNGLYYWLSADGQPGIYYYDLPTGQHQTLWTAPQGYSSGGFHVHPEEKQIILTGSRRGESDIMLVEG